MCNADGIWVDDHENLLALVRNFYVDLFKKDTEKCETIVSWTTYTSNVEEHYTTLNANVQLKDIERKTQEMKVLNVFFFFKNKIIKNKL